MTATTLHENGTRTTPKPIEYTVLTPDRQRELWQNALATFEEQHYIAVMNIAVAIDPPTREKFAKDAAALVRQIAEARAQLDTLTAS